MSKVTALYHIVFCTKHRKNTIPETNRENLYRFIWAKTKEQNCSLLRIGGIANHVHMLVNLNPSIDLAKFVAIIKASSSGWLQQNPEYPSFTGWAKEYFASTIAPDAITTVAEYIKNQKEHHSHTPLDEEFRRIYSYAGLSYHQDDMTD